MAHIDRIKIGDSTYNLVPEIGSGLQLGTSLDNSHVIYVNVGKAASDDPAMPETGMSITPLGFVVETEKFRKYIKALGFKCE